MAQTKKKDTLWRQVERILPTVMKPGRYVGGELNQIAKPWDSVRTHIALAFPDIYDLGQANLGLALLYDQINQRQDAAAERTFSPWTDMEAAMRAASIPLYSLENKRPLLDFEILGVSLPYETLYTNFLNLLDLASIPLMTQERTVAHPLVLAGGQAVYNPEPVAPFVDAFLIGEGEEAIHEIINAYQRWEESKRDREELLANLTNIPGVYVPSFYTVTYHPSGTLQAITPTHEHALKPITKRIAAKLPPPVTDFLVPNVEVVQERVSVEIMRGCTRGCRFCHAGMVNRPIRERPVEDITQALTDGLEKTGYEEISLLSLSSSDHSQIIPLIDALKTMVAARRVNITLPSLRIESFSEDLMDALKDLTPGGGFTLAPEAGTERLRNIINKPLTDAAFLETVRSVFKHGWHSIKLYFMIGHPQETMEDVAAIADLSQQALAIGRQSVGGRARLHLGISTFIPKPHTPFQWVPFEDPERIQKKIDLLHEALRGAKIKMSWNNPRASLLEAWLARGDRRMADVILKAWQDGARFDAWSEHFDITHWEKAFQQTGLDPDFYSRRAREMDEILPWDHINAGVTKAFLQKDYTWSLEGRIRPDCRSQCYNCGILSSFNTLRLAHPGGGWKCP